MLYFRCVIDLDCRSAFGRDPVLSTSQSFDFKFILSLECKSCGAESLNKSVSPAVFLAHLLLMKGLRA